MVKITKGQHSDKDPFAALIQALAAVAHLATPCQYERLRHFFPNARFRETDRPRLDAYILPVGLDLDLTQMRPIFDATKRLSAALVERPEVHPALGRIVCLELKPG